MNKDFKINLEGTTLTVGLDVELTRINAPSLQELLSSYRDQDIQKIVFDATDLAFISSAGIRCIIFARREVGDKPEIVFENCAPEIYEVFQITGLHRFISFVENDRKAKGNKAHTGEMFHKKLDEDRQQELDDFAANNDVTCYQMKLGEEE